MQTRVVFSLRNYCIGFWWGEGKLVNSRADHVFAIVLPMVAVMFLWSNRKKVKV